jgi:hypothetical protein
MRAVLSVLLFAAVAAPNLQANIVFPFQGTFSTDDQVQLFDFTLLSDATVTFQSYGYGGGTDAADIAISPGGFDSLFSWFSADGTQLGTSAPNGCGSANSNNGACLDAFAQPFLTAGSYILALTTSQNTPNGDLNQGFAQQGNGNFTCAQGFCDVFANQNDGHWAIDILSVAAASEVTPGVPEPVTTLLGACGLAAIALAKRRGHKYRP